MQNSVRVLRALNVFRTVPGNCPPTHQPLRPLVYSVCVAGEIFPLSFQPNRSAAAGVGAAGAGVRLQEGRAVQARVHVCLSAGDQPARPCRHHVQQGGNGAQRRPRRGAGEAAALSAGAHRRRPGRLDRGAQPGSAGGLRRLSEAGQRQREQPVQAHGTTRAELNMHVDTVARGRTPLPAQGRREGRDPEARHRRRRIRQSQRPPPSAKGASGDDNRKAQKLGCANAQPTTRSRPTAPAPAKSADSDRRRRQGEAAPSRRSR